jgi:hypothetical protein
MGLEKDLPPGEKLMACFRPFIEHLAASSLSPRTIQNHVDNLWALGGEIIRYLHEDPSLRRKDIEEILDARIDEEGGPLVYAYESEEALQRSLDSTCRKLYRFRSQPPRRPHKSPTNSADEAQFGFPWKMMGCRRKRDGATNFRSGAMGLNKRI